MNSQTLQPAVPRHRASGPVPSGPRPASQRPDAAGWEEDDDGDPGDWGAVLEDLLRGAGRGAHAAAAADLLPA
jgi:hypothetical protein